MRMTLTDDYQIVNDSENLEDFKTKPQNRIKAVIV
jgi:hypothetical protein